MIKPDLVAPGNRILGALSYANSGYNTIVSLNPAAAARSATPQPSTNGLMELSGTSISAPVVAGAVALMLQANPGLTPPLVKAILQYTAQPLPGASLVQQGAGLLNIEGAVRLAACAAHGRRRRGRCGHASGPATGCSARQDAARAGVDRQRRNRRAGAALSSPAVRMSCRAAALFQTYQGFYDPRVAWVARLGPRLQPGVLGRDLPANTYMSYARAYVPHPAGNSSPPVSFSPTCLPGRAAMPRRPGCSHG